jgi:hypothetical protein
LYPPIGARQRLSKNVPAATNTCNNIGIVGSCFFYAVRVVLKESRRLVLADRLFENVAQFKYLGTTITNQNLIQEEIKRD